MVKIRGSGLCGVIHTRYSHHKIYSWWQTSDKELRTFLPLISNCNQHTCTWNIMLIFTVLSLFLCS